MEDQSINRPLKLLRRPEVEQRTGLKRSTIYENMAKGTFPKPIKIGARIVCWTEQAIETWIEAQLAISAAEGP